jgi:hypothetical protein
VELPVAVLGDGAFGGSRRIERLIRVAGAEERERSILDTDLAGGDELGDEARQVVANEPAADRTLEIGVDLDLDRRRARTEAHAVRGSGRDDAGGSRQHGAGWNWWLTGRAEIGGQDQGQPDHEGRPGDDDDRLAPGRPGRLLPLDALSALEVAPPASGEFGRFRALQVVAPVRPAARVPSFGRTQPRPYKDFLRPPLSKRAERTILPGRTLVAHTG